MSETALAFQWVATTMQADAALMAASTGGIYQDFAPMSTVPPYTLVAQQSGSDVNTVNAKRIKTDILMRMQAIGQSGPGGNYAALVTIADRIDALFKDVRNVGLAGGVVLACYREQPLSYPDEVNGQPWSYLGGLYHIEITGS